ncbi:secretory phospholipase A2 receptor-like isoform X1 [Syngnathus acus]|uniref:secretory phospholipase A2 receptor-like isoform X1 n=1 Tax=Syngnathus acus TaxID=161584 RepID=UPI001885B214|nr:secretory phospholipase A2 receptor-like isoform X1 [Syngnathus acus]
MLSYVWIAGWTEKCGWWLDDPSDDFCYLMIRQPTKTWQEAQADCKGRQGNLLSIADSDEQGFVRGIAKILMGDASLWLGADASIKRDGDKWTDGSPFSYLRSSAGRAEAVVSCTLEERMSAQILSPSLQVSLKGGNVFPCSLAAATGSATSATRREATSARKEVSEM